MQPGKDFVLANNWRSKSLLPALNKITKHTFITRSNISTLTLQNKLASELNIPLCICCFRIHKRRIENSEMTDAVSVELANASDAVWDLNSTRKLLKHKTPTAQFFNLSFMSEFWNSHDAIKFPNITPCSCKSEAGFKICAWQYKIYTNNFHFTFHFSSICFEIKWLISEF